MYLRNNTEFTKKNDITLIELIDIIREEQYGNGNSRGEAVLKIVTAAADKAKDPACQEKVINAALEQYSKGNIIMSPQGLFMDLLKTKGIEKLMT